MRARSISSPASPLLWFAVLGPPAAWAGQFAAGYWLAEASCDRSDARWTLGHELATIGLTVAAAVVVAAAAATSLSIYRGARDADDDDAPPPGRNHFLATVGLTVAVLFFFLVVMTGVGVSVLSPCNQS